MSPVFAVETVTVYGIISGSIVSVITLGVALRSSRGDHMASTLTGALDLGDRYKALADDVEADLAAMRIEMKGMAAALSKCHDQHALAEAEIAELRAHECFQGELPWFILDHHGGIASFNDAYMDLFGLTRSQANETANWRDTVVPDDLTRLDREALRTFTARSELSTDFRVVSDGRLVKVLARAFPRFDESGNFHGWIGILAPQWGSSTPAPPGASSWPAAPPAPWGTYP